MSSLTDRFKRKPVQIEDKSTPGPVIPEGVKNAPPPTEEQKQAVLRKGTSAPPDQQDEIAELKAKLAAAEAKNAPLQAPASVPGALQAGNLITPPDQPKSDPKLAADPVPGFSPIPVPLKDAPPAPAETHNTAAVPPAPPESAPKGRGRPPGAKNKPKEEAPQKTIDIATSGLEGWVPKTPVASTQITRVKVSLGATVKFDPDDPKCFEFIRADVGLERDVVGGDEEVKAARQKISEECAQSLVEELEKMKANTK